MYANIRTIRIHELFEPLSHWIIAILNEFFGIHKISSRKFSFICSHTHCRLYNRKQYKCKHKWNSTSTSQSTAMMQCRTIIFITYKTPMPSIFHILFYIIFIICWHYCSLRNIWVLCVRAVFLLLKASATKTCSTLKCRRILTRKKCDFFL